MDPEQYGWTYQGTNERSRVSFYERDGVKMDHYYTTGEQECSYSVLGAGPAPGAVAAGQHLEAIAN